MRVFFALIALLGFYPMQGEVIDTLKDASVIETADGNLWEWLDSSLPHCAVFLIMHDNGTEEIEDDVIIEVFQ